MLLFLVPFYKYLEYNFTSKTNVNLKIIFSNYLLKNYLLKLSFKKDNFLSFYLSLSFYLLNYLFKKWCLKQTRLSVDHHLSDGHVFS